MNDFTRVLNPGFIHPSWYRSGRGVRVFVRVEYSFGQLSIYGVEGPTRSGNAVGSCGQIDLTAIDKLEKGWAQEMLRQLIAVWKRWNLNNFRAGCEHQREMGWGKETVEVVTYRLTTEALKLRRSAMTEAARAAVAGEVANLDATSAALLDFDIGDMRYTAPDAEGPLSGMMEVATRETRHAGFVSPNEHPLGVLSKPCPVCGYKHGSSWLREDVPDDVLEWLKSLPETTVKPAWV